MEQVQRADGLSAQPQRQRVHRPERSGFARPRRRRPATGWPRGEVGHADRGAGAVAVQAGALLVLQLQQLHQLGVLAGGGDHAQLSVGVAEHDPGGVGGQQGHAVGDEPVEQVDDVVVVDQGVGERDEGPAHGLFTIGLAHDNSFFSGDRHRFTSCPG